MDILIILRLKKLWKIKQSNWQRSSVPKDTRHAQLLCRKNRRTDCIYQRASPDVICMVDNCYGEFVERIEPSDVGADMIVGSLIKIRVADLSPIGGYVAGRADLIENRAYRLTSPGLGKEVSATLGVTRPSIRDSSCTNCCMRCFKGCYFLQQISTDSFRYPVIPERF